MTSAFHAALPFHPAAFDNRYGKPDFAEEQKRLKAALQHGTSLQRDFVPLPIEGQKGAGGGKGR
jgi:hypothetical protein